LAPSLVALTGPLQGQTFELRGGEIAVGRHPSNDLRLPDPSVSRQHCVLRRAADRWRVADLESRRGTFVNGLPIRERDLAHGDFLVVGASTFLISLGSARPEESGPAAGEATEDALLAGETEIRLAVADSIFLRQDRLPSAIGALLEIAGAPAAGSAALGQHLLERVLATVPAERAALLPVEEDGEGPAPLYRTLQGERPFPVSRTAVARVLGERTALLVDRGRGDAAAGSIESAGIRSLACVPLLAPEGPLGVLYAGSARRTCSGSPPRPPWPPDPWRPPCAPSGWRGKTAASRPPRWGTAWWGRARPCAGSTM
jgi:Inner membrane component of T3SS, cytoplasmic domain